jgi:ABC-type transporter Mla subunit MlaD
MRREGETRRIPHWLFGLLIVVVTAVGFVLAYNKRLPFDDRHEIQVVVANARGLNPNAPVRIAGVNIGRVAEIEGVAPGSDGALGDAAAGYGGAAILTIEVDENGLPLKEDARFRVRPRLFLEGNAFIDVEPGSPSAAEVPEGYVFPITQTSHYVQLDEVITTASFDVRASLQSLLDDLGRGLIDEEGAKGLNQFYETSAGAFKYSAQVGEALLGTERHDLSGLITNLDRVFKALTVHERELGTLVSDLNAFTGALANEGDALEQSLADLPALLDAGGPALVSITSALPQVRTLAREALPGVESLSPTLDAATPLMTQLSALASEQELRGLVADLSPAVGDLVTFTREGITLFEEGRLISSCVNEVVVPFSNTPVSSSDPTYPHNPDAPPYKQLAYGLVGISGESRSGDANGQYVKTGTGSGQNVVIYPPSQTAPFEQFGTSAFPILGAAPGIDSSAKTPYRPDVPCETQEPPNVDAGPVASPPEQEAIELKPASELTGPVGDAARRLEAIVLGPLSQASELFALGLEDEAMALQDRMLERWTAYLNGGFDPFKQAILELPEGSGGEGP